MRSLLWEEICGVLQGFLSSSLFLEGSLCSGDGCMGALVLRLKLVLQLHRLGQGVPEGWSPEADFLTWASHGPVA